MARVYALLTSDIVQVPLYSYQVIKGLLVLVTIQSVHIPIIFQVFVDKWIKRVHAYIIAILQIAFNLIHFNDCIIELNTKIILIE